MTQMSNLLLLTLECFLMIRFSLSSHISNITIAKNHTHAINDYQPEEQRLALQIITTDIDDGGGNSSQSEDGELIAKTNNTEIRMSSSDINQDNSAVDFEKQFNLLTKQILKGKQNERKLTNESGRTKRIIINLSTSNSSKSDSGGTKLTIGLNAQPKSNVNQAQSNQTSSTLKKSGSERVKEVSKVKSHANKSKPNSMKDLIMEAVHKQGGVPAIIMDNKDLVAMDQKGQLEANSGKNRNIKLMLRSEAVDSFKNAQMKMPRPSKQVNHYSHSDETLHDDPESSNLESDKRRLPTNAIESMSDDRDSGFGFEDYNGLDKEAEGNEVKQNNSYQNSGLLASRKEQEQVQENLMLPEQAPTEMNIKKEIEVDNQGQNLLEHHNPFLIIEGDRNVANFDSSPDKNSHRSNIQRQQSQRKLSSNNHEKEKSLNRQQDNNESGPSSSKSVESTGPRSRDIEISEKNNNFEKRQHARRRRNFINPSPVNGDNSKQLLKQVGTQQQQTQQNVTGGNYEQSKKPNSPTTGVSEPSKSDAPIYSNDKRLAGQQSTMVRNSAKQPSQQAVESNTRQEQSSQVQRQQRQQQPHQRTEDRLAELMNHLKLYTTKDQLMKVAQDLQAYPEREADSFENESDNDPTNEANAGFDEAPITGFSRGPTSSFDSMPPLNDQDRPNSLSQASLSGLQNNRVQVNLDSNLINSKRYPSDQQTAVANPEINGNKPSSSDWRFNLIRNFVPAPVPYDVLDSLATSTTSSRTSDNYGNQNLMTHQRQILPEQHKQFTGNFLHRLIADQSSARSIDDPSSRNAGSRVINQYRVHKDQLRDNFDRDFNDDENQDTYSMRSPNMKPDGSEHYQSSGESDPGDGDEDNEATEESQSVPETTVEGPSMNQLLNEVGEDYTSKKDLIELFRDNEKLFNTMINDDNIFQPEEFENNQNTFNGTRIGNRADEEEEIKAMEQIIDELVDRQRKEQAMKRSSNQRGVAN